MANRILILDDDTDILAICTYILEEQGWEVFTSTNCNNIVERVRQIAPQAILMDNWIPDTGGIVATQSLKNEADLKHIPIIYFSANNDIHTLARQAGADTFLSKPFNITDLEEVISTVVSGAKSA
ncbi:response regulator (plasmid) [Pedobacter sp. BS3]|uniref:response regulator n=1 Tax=Pedobacter sp. BS3 TaxID=2567937 RepID=UPI0011EDDF60|nr:response regulator [Pedobacter sp. BS3]TZF85805.1 response regulator [Pedobacter sp. BS3]